MRQKIYLTASLVLLFVIIFYIAKDLFRRGEINYSPFGRDPDEIAKEKAEGPAYKEINQFATGIDSIFGIAIDHSDMVYVSGVNGLAILDNSGKQEMLIPLKGIARTVAVDKAGQIYLGMEDHIMILDHSGQLLSEWKPESNRSILTSIAVTPTDVFVADAGEKVVYHYDHSGKLLNRIGEKEPQNGIPGFVIPSPYFDLGISPAGKLWVVDPGRHTFMNFSYDGKLISKWGKSSMSDDGFCGCCNPSHFSFLPDGSFVTSEKSIDRVKIYSPEGIYLKLIAGQDCFTAGTRGLDLAVDSIDRIFILDPVMKKIRVFVKK
jgi:hypothetical protein